MLATRLFLVTYHPLVATPFGRAAAERDGLQPFIDGSIRREPDLEHCRPAISCLCRAGRFAPRLRVGYVVAYMTVKSRYLGQSESHRRLAAVLRVTRVHPNHTEAATWYTDNAMALPSNCMVPGNPPKPIAQSHRKHDWARILGDGDLLRRWDAEYRVRARRHGTFVVCEAIFRNLAGAAPVVTDTHLRRAFGGIPGTQNPGALPPEGLLKLAHALGIDVPPSSP